MTTMPPICLYCEHFWEGSEFKCDAFHDRIPQQILESQWDHRQPIEGDHGIQFAPKDQEAVAYARELFDEDAGDAAGGDLLPAVT